MSNFIPKIGLFQELLISERIHLNQVSQLFLLVQTLLYHDLAKNLAQNCPKNYYQHSTGGVLYSKLINSSSLCWFDGKKCSFFRNNCDRILDYFSTYTYILCVLQHFSTQITEFFSSLQNWFHKKMGIFLSNPSLIFKPANDFKEKYV